MACKAFQANSDCANSTSECSGHAPNISMPGDSQSASPRTDLSNGFERFGFSLSTYMSSYLKLGLGNLSRVAIHRSLKRAGIYRRILPISNPVPLNLSEHAFDGTGKSSPWPEPSTLPEADDLISGVGRYFSVHRYEVGNPPDWFFNPFTQRRHAKSQVHWSSISDFDSDVGDIKVIWEMSRFMWAPILARAWRSTRDTRYLSTLLNWVADWWRNNPPNAGPNWMCGQEVSVRLINTLLAMRLAELRGAVEPGLAAFVEAHCRRISSTTIYARAQENNHIISEAASLFIGGSWLAAHSSGDVARRGQRWALKGRRLLEQEVRSLVAPDGSFSQHSLTYHRLMLDTLTVTEALRQQTAEAPFSQELYKRAEAATRWLGAMIDPVNGDGPNFGGNDGAYPYQLAAGDYRDFRPCLQSSSLAFLHQPWLAPGPWDEAPAWLGLALRPHRPYGGTQKSSELLPNGGYVAIRNNAGIFLLLRAPTARFRPAHADALHLDLWSNGVNVLRDGGTYSYGHGDGIAPMLSSVRGHNLPEFDDSDQMPRLGRFLYGRWVRVDGDDTIRKSNDQQSWSGSYTDAFGRYHRRTAVLSDTSLSVFDRLQGFEKKAVLRWRLAPGDWSTDQAGFSAGAYGRITVKCDVPVRRIGLVTGWESRHYLEKTPIPVIEVEVGRSPANIITTISFA